MALRLELSCAGGLRRTLENPISLELSSAMDSPAASLDIAFAVPGQLAPAIELALYDGAEPLFDGLCDEQTLTVSAAGRLLRFCARSRGALLLDNEMQPQVFYNLTAAQFYRRFIRPYGFAGCELPSRAAAGVFRVNKGFSVWEAFTQLCFLLYGRAPVVTPDDIVFVGRPDSVPRCTVSNRAGLSALRYLSLEEIHRRASVISEVRLRDSEGAYSTRIGNPYGNPYAVQRRRYVVPAPELAEAPRLDALQRITNAQRGAHSLRAVLPGLYPLAPGNLLRLDDPWLGKRLMTAYRVVLERGESGDFTRLTLADTTYV